MPRPRYTGGAYNPVFFPRWHYLGGQTLTMDGTSQQLTIRGGTTIIEIRAETAAVYFNINAVATVNSPGFIPASGGDLIGPLSNLNTVSLWGVAADAAIAHIMYFREN